MAERADLFVWIDLERAVVMWRVVRRTLRRALRNDALWNGNREPSLLTIFSNPDHIVRWAWRTHAATAERVRGVGTQRPELPVVRLQTPREVERWVHGPLVKIV